MPRDDAALTRWEARTERPLLGLALAFIVVLVLPLVVELNSAADTALRAANAALWLAFAADYLVRLALSPERWRFVRTHPVDLLVVLVPFFRPLRVLRLARAARIGAVASVVTKRTRRTFHGAAALYVAVTTCALLFVAASAMYDAERDADGNIKTFGDALWWAATTVTTVGYGDRFPVTTQGRAIAVGLMVVGIALLGVITASVAAWFVDRLRKVEEAEEENAATLGQVLAELRELRRELGR